MAAQQLSGRACPRGMMDPVLHVAHPFAVRAPSAARPRRQRRSRVLADAGEGPPGSTGAKGGITEDVLERLRKAEAEAASLRAQLKASRPAVQPEQASEVMGKRPSRIDGSALKRETLFTSKEERGSWLNEADFLTGGGPSETEEKGGATAEEQATVQRRLLIGVLASVGLGAFALVPLDSLRGKPSKPLFYYLTPLVRVQALLVNTEDIVADARWQELAAALSRIQGGPNYIKQNVDDAVACLEDSKRRDQATTIGTDLKDYIAQIDYQKYFDAMGAPGARGGQREAEFAEFSLQAVRAAEKKLAELLALMPLEDLEAAQQQANVSAF